nr:SCO family protein [Allobacillus saliphilus]
MTDFQFTTQDNDTLSFADLKDDWWIANFMYTHCEAVCPITTERMADLQNKLAKEGLHPQIVSFSVDPSNDTPEVLKEYASHYDANFDSWSFLTGYDFETIQDLSQETFKANLAKGAVGLKSHGVNFYLINPKGIIVKKYNGMNADDLELLFNDVKRVK